MPERMSSKGDIHTGDIGSFRRQRTDLAFEADGDPSRLEAAHRAAIDADASLLSVDLHPESDCVGLPTASYLNRQCSASAEASLRK